MGRQALPKGPGPALPAVLGSVAVRATLLIVLTVIAYYPAMHGGFIWDDNLYISENPLLTAPDGLRKIWFSLQSPSQYFPLVYTSFRLEYAWWGLNTQGYHWVNLILHITNALFAWRLLKCLKVPGAWLAAAIFALHPVQVESVAWITERKNVLMVFFFLLSLLAWLKYIDPPTRNRWLFYMLALISYILALSAKTTACTLPVVLLLIFWLRRENINVRRAVAIAPFVLLGFAMGMVTIWWERHHIGTHGLRFALSPLERLLIVSRGVWFYLGKLLWPTNLAFFYPKWRINESDPLGYFWPFACAVLAVGIYFARRWTGRSIAAGLLFFIATLSPVAGFIMLYTFRYTFVADHYQYLAMLGPVALVSAGVTTSIRRTRYGRWFLPFVICVVLLALDALTMRQGAMYGDIETLWRTTIARNPGCAVPYNNLGNILLKRGDVDGALAFYKKGSDVDPANAEPEYNLGAAFLSKRNWDEAIMHSQKALALDPAFTEAYYNLGNAYLGKEDYAHAVDSYQLALRARPNNAIGHCNLGVSLVAIGKVSQGILQFEEALRVDPNYAPAHYNLGYTFMQIGRRNEAVDHLKKAVALKPNYNEAIERLRELGVTGPPF